jgi:putative oxidoreductase
MKNAVLVDYAALLLLVALAWMFIAHASLKIKVCTPAAAVQYFHSLGVPGFLAYLTVAAEIA